MQIVDQSNSQYYQWKDGCDGWHLLKRDDLSFHPYQMVKDLRTSLETTAVGDVMNGELDEFIEACIRQKNQMVIVDRPNLVCFITIKINI